jgi:predicted ATPase
MDGKRLLNSIRLRNLLSYGAEGVTLELEPLNVLIGPNAVGKSNLIEAISLLAAAPRDLLTPIREGGGTSEWIWKGDEKPGVAVLEVKVEYQEGPLLYRLGFSLAGYRFDLVGEDIYLYSEGQLVYGYSKDLVYVSMPKKDDPGQSILSQVRGAEHPEITHLANSFGRITFFREGNQGRFVASRMPQKADLPEDFLLENAGNLGLVLNDLQHRPAIRHLILEKLKEFNENIVDVTTKVQGGTVQVYFHERGLREPVPATRLSDGTLRYLCLLVILLHPDPPPLICIEEPELGLHPDIIRTVGKLLIDASQRTQLIVTTHSDFLVSALSEVPEAVVVCERGSKGTELRRLDPERLKDWLEKYTLGELWSMGEIGGNRW